MTLPTLFLGHGGGPFPLMGAPHHAELIETWKPGGIVHSVLHDPAVRAVVVVSGHHESADGAVDVMADPQPTLLFDYSGFPAETYEYTLPNPGSPELAEQVLDLLSGANIPARAQTGRGRDHGLFIPMLGLGVDTARPELPIIAVSLRGPAGYRDALTDDHLAMGQALSALRSEGVLIVGSGNSIHGRCTPEQALAYDDHLRSLSEQGPAALSRWAEHPATRACHPRPEHLVPLLVCAGAAPESKVTGIPHDFMGFASRHVLFRD